MDAFNMYQSVEHFLNCDDVTLRERIAHLQKLAQNLFEISSEYVTMDEDGNVVYWTEPTIKVVNDV